MHILLVRGSSAVAILWSLAAQCQTRVAVPDPGVFFSECQGCPEIVVVPAGDFMMGSPYTPQKRPARKGEVPQPRAFEYERPQHKVTIAQPFAVGRREVTFDEWDQCSAAGACGYHPKDQGWGRGDRPVIDVSWEDAQDFVDWLSHKTGKRYRLPSEAEWEYAARAGTDTTFWWGDTAEKGRANCEDCGAAPTEKKTVPVGSFRPNGFGLFNVAGNAAEWVEDCWHESYRGAPPNGAAWTYNGQCRQRVLRGGSFASEANLIRSAARFRYDLDVRYYANGFRIARDLR
jgi:formylglycine-generating enzyme required for sulfatase activity